MLLKPIIGEARNCSKGLAFLLLLWWAAPVSTLQAQEVSDSTASAETATTTADVPATPTARVSLLCIQSADDSIHMEATVKAKIDGVLETLEGIPVLFYKTGADSASFLGKAVTNSRGVAFFSAPAKDCPPAEDGTLTFSAKSEAQAALEEGEDEISFTRAKLTLAPMEEDSSRNVTVRVVAGDENGTPLAEIEVGLFVKRLFSFLKVGEGTTDENGEVTIAFPTNLPGDPKGNVTIVARVDEHETYGNLSAAMQQSWGVPVPDDPAKMPRALWSHIPPLWMVVTFAILMSVVWGHFFVIIYKLYRLKHEI